MLSGALFPTDLIRKKREGERIVAVTAYDYPTAVFVDRAGVDLILVGDSLGMVIQGKTTTLAVTLEHMLYHARCVRRGVERAIVAVDLPFMSYQVSTEQALRSAGRVLKETGASAVKVEGGTEVGPTVLRLTTAGIPVIGHIGLTPQSYHAVGGYRVQGRSDSDAERLLNAARVLEEAGVSAIVLEAIPRDLGGRVTRSVNVPTIGIGAGPECDGQILVLHDLLGLTPSDQPTGVGSELRSPRFVKRYRELGEEIQAAISEYGADVRSGRFPGSEHSY